MNAEPKVQARPMSPASIIGILLLAVGLGAATLYFVLSAKIVSKPAEAVPLPPSATAPHAVQQQINAMVEKLAARMANEPQNGNGWLMLARSYAAMGDFQKSAAAFARVETLLPKDANILADHADVLAMAHQGDFRGEPAKMISQALAIDPKHAKALALAGTEAYKRDDFVAARRFWQQALAVAPPQSEIAAAAKNSIAEIDAKAKSATAR